jgi:hypothetical protein
MKKPLRTCAAWRRDGARRDLLATVPRGKSNIIICMVPVIPYVLFYVKISTMWLAVKGSKGNRCAGLLRAHLSRLPYCRPVYRVW